MKKFLSLFLFCFCIFVTNFSIAEDIYNFSSKKQEVQFDHLVKELRCLVCQNQDIRDSNSRFAKDLKKEVYNLVIANKSDNEIITYLSNRFGDFVLFNPPVKLLTLFLWFGPLIFSISGLVFFWRLCLRNSYGS